MIRPYTSRAACHGTPKMAMLMTILGDRVGGPPAGGDTGRADHDGQRGKAVGSRAQPVGDERRRADPPTDPDP
jgi:hypothetical protein